MLVEYIVDHCRTTLVSCNNLVVIGVFLLVIILVEITGVLELELC